MRLLWLLKLFLLKIIPLLVLIALILRLLRLEKEYKIYTKFLRSVLLFVVSIAAIVIFFSRWLFTASAKKVARSLENLKLALDNAIARERTQQGLYWFEQDILKVLLEKLNQMLKTRARFYLGFLLYVLFLLIVTAIALFLL